jgi:precorrin-6x reductase
MSKKAILIIAGTQEARQIIAQLLEMSHLQIHATVATTLGGEFLQPYPEIEIHSGRRGQRDLAELIYEIKAVALIDASHPFAGEVSQNAMNACNDTGIPYLRYERAKTPGVTDKVLIAVDFLAAAAKVAAMPGNILLTIGSNHVEIFVKEISDYRERLYIRVLPESQALQKCENLGLTARNILAIKGPFTEMMNLEMYRYCKAAVVVTKDSGEIGGSATKISAAARLNIPVIMIARPQMGYGSKVVSIKEIIEFGKGLSD